MTEDSQSPPKDEIIVEVKSLCKNYGALRALVDASFCIRRGEIIALLGPNGAGKTTIMKILTGFLEPSSGEILIDHVNIREDKLSVQKVIGYLPENAPIYGDMLVQEYLLLVADLRGIPQNHLQDRMAEAIRNTGIAEVLVRPIRELSKGYRQRVGLAQAILHRPKLLILDEPTNGLDPTQIAEMRGLIKKLARDSTVLLSTHILSEAQATCDRAIIISRGEIKADARLGELSEASEVLLTVCAQNGKPGPAAREVMKTLEQVQGVKKVTEEADETPGYLSFRLTGEGRNRSGRELAQRIFNQAKSAGWEVCELRPESKTLEHVFKELV